MRYKGYFYDEESGYYYCKSRYYVPNIGRWLTPDKVKYLDNSVICGYNPFIYCRNNPIMYVDEDGNMPEWNKWLLGVLGGALGLALVGAEAAYSSSRALEKINGRLYPVYLLGILALRLPIGMKLLISQISLKCMLINLNFKRTSIILFGHH